MQVQRRGSRLKVVGTKYLASTWPWLTSRPAAAQVCGGGVTVRMQHARFCVSTCLAENLQAYSLSTPLVSVLSPLKPIMMVQHLSHGPLCGIALSMSCGCLLQGGARWRPWVSRIYDWDVEDINSEGYACGPFGGN